MTVWTDIGNIQKFDVTPNPTTIKHKKTRGGLKTIDKVAVTLIEMAFSAALDEWTLDNLRLALLGQIATDTTGEYMKIGVDVIERQLKFVGDGKFGGRFEVILPRVFINAKDAIAFLADGDNDFGRLPLSGDILADATLNAFGTVRALAGSTGSAPVNSPDELNYYIGTGILYSAPLA